MFRFTLLPLILLFGGLFFSLISYFIYRKVKKGLKATYEKGADLINEQQEKWKQQEQIKKLPDILQKGWEDIAETETHIQKLPLEWSALLNPLLINAKGILTEISTEHTTADLREFEHKLDSIRTFFIHSLDALKQFSEKLESDHVIMTQSDKNKARENIALINDDLLHHQKILHKKRKFDFDVLMDVIKVRLKS